MNNDKFLENIALKLSPKVLQHISSNIYRQPASAFKELASNAFDASATRFEIKFKIKSPDKGGDKEPKLVGIEIKDNGDGISLEDFQSIFTNIGYSKKVKDLSYDSQDKYNQKMNIRPVIGRIGIGLFSVVAASDEFEIESRQEGKQCYVARTKLPDFARLNVTNIDLDSFETGDAEIYEKKESAEKSPSYTKITIQNFKKPFMEEIMNNFKESVIYSMKEKHKSEDEILDLEGEFRTFLNKIFNEGKSVDHLNANIDKFIYNLAVQLPIEYMSDGPFKDCVELSGAFGDDNPSKIIKEIKERLQKYNFNVFFALDFVDEISSCYEMKLFKPISLPTQQDIEKFGEKTLVPTAFLYKKVDKIPNEIGDQVEIEISMYSYKQAKRIVSYEFRGILFRVYDVAIGTHDYEKLRPYNTSALQFQTSYEIFMNKGFQSAVNVDRESLYEASYAYRYLKRYFEYVLGEMDDIGAENAPSTEDDSSTARGKSEILHGYGSIVEEGYSTSKDAIKPNQNDPEISFAEKLQKEFSSPNLNPLIKALNALRMKNSMDRKKLKTEMQKHNPLLSIIKYKFKTDLETLDDIVLEESENVSFIEENENRVVMKTKFKLNKSIKLPFLDAVLLANLKLKGEDKDEFLSSLEELYKFYADKE